MWPISTAMTFALDSNYTSRKKNYVNLGIPFLPHTDKSGRIHEATNVQRITTLFMPGGPRIVRLACFQTIFFTSIYRSFDKNVRASRRTREQILLLAIRHDKSWNTCATKIFVTLCHVRFNTRSRATHSSMFEKQICD